MVDWLSSGEAGLNYRATRVTHPSVNDSSVVDEARETYTLNRFQPSVGISRLASMFIHQGEGYIP
jgi:hypothetical protein